MRDKLEEICELILNEGKVFKTVWEEILMNPHFTGLKTGHLKRFYQGASGMFGTVITKPEWNFVLKIYNRDEQYKAFIRYARDYPSPYLPKVHYRKENVPTVLEPKTVNIVIMEKLLPLTKAEYETIGETTDRIETEVINGTRSSRLDDIILNSGVHAGFLTFIRNMLHIIYKKDPRHFAPDLHGGNIMKRPDGSWVVVDPISAFNTLEP